jgi:amino acid transporter
VLYSIAILALLYMAMTLSVIGVLPWREAAQSNAIMSLFMEKLYGAKAASAMTVLILWVAFASVFCVLLGYTRVPYAAAAEGKFFRAFARVHPKEHFPSFSVVFMGVLSAAACFFTLEQLIKELIILQILTWFAAQCVAVVLIRRLRPEIRRPFSMPLYPLPVLVALGGWLYILFSSEKEYTIAGLAMLLVGVGAYLWRAKRLREWPFAERSQS